MKAPDFLNLIASERGMPAGWRWYSWNIIGEGEHAAVVVKGAVPGPVFTKGKRKGEINWSKATHAAELVITRRDEDARREQWERETGNCCECGGDGQAWAGWSAAKGNYYSKCDRCKGTGKAPEAAP